MQRYLAQRVISLFIILLILSLAVFLVLRVMPGDVVGAIALSSEGGTTLTEEEIQAVRTRLGLNRPLYEQYLSWIGAILTRGDLGVSLYTKESINSLLKQRLPITLLLALYSVTVMIGLGLPLGILSALKPNSFIDNVARVVAVMGLAIPGFWLGILVLIGLVIIFTWSPPLIYSSPIQNPLEHVQKMFWPALISGFGSGAIMARMTRSSMLEVLSEDYVRTARSKGLSERLVILVHVLRNALLPVLSIVGVQVATLMGGIIVMERVFGIPGFGGLLIGAVQNRDYTVVQSALLVVATLVVLVNLVTDILYAYIDPRIRYR